MQSDKLTRWARPGILWLGMISMFLTDIALPVASKILNLDLPKLTLDPNFWDAWSWAVSIFVAGRSIEKIGLPAKFRGAADPVAGPADVKKD